MLRMSWFTLHGLRGLTCPPVPYMQKLMIRAHCSPYMGSKIDEKGLDPGAAHQIAILPFSDDDNQVASVLHALYDGKISLIMQQF